MNNRSSFPHTEATDSFSVGSHGGMFIRVDCLRKGNIVRNPVRRSGDIIINQLNHQFRGRGKE